MNSRLLRLDEGEFDALVLARAGLARIGMAGRAAETFDTDTMCPAVGAGVIGNSPIAGHCSTTPDGQLALRGMVFTRDGGEFVPSREDNADAYPARTDPRPTAARCLAAARGVGAMAH